MLNSFIKTILGLPGMLILGQKHMIFKPFFMDRNIFISEKLFFLSHENL